MVRSERDRTWVRALLAGVAVFAAVLSVSVIGGGGGTARAQDGSSTTVSARDQDANIDDAPQPDLEITVSQTSDLIAQAITVSWTGGKPATLPSGQTGGENFLQIMQCWGDVTESNGDVGPDRTTCQFGGFNTAGASRDLYYDSELPIAAEDEAYSDEGSSFFDQTYTGIPFRSVDGGLVERVVDGKVVDGVDLNNNQFFTRYTTNEVSWAGSASDGTGAVTFETQTTLASPGLGCGRPITAADGTISGQSCWLVVVPRGSGTNTASPLFAEQWKHRLAVRLGFQPVGTHCAIGVAERQLAGSELVSDAVSSWQPSLCGAEGGDAYTLLTTTDVDAAGQSNTTADAPLTLTSQAIDTSGGTTDDLTYAPIALTGVAVAFAIDRFPSSDADTDAQERARQPFTEMNLTPRLLAKLLTSSYTDALPSNADKAHLQDNPRNLLFDPEFLAINDEDWANQAIVNPAVADIMVPQGRSGYARAVWNYILADADARAFLGGAPDANGMIVNPWATTDPTSNLSGAAQELPRDDFPKADPSEAYSGEARVLNSVTWRPYTNDLASGAYYALRGDGLTTSEWDPTSVPAKWLRAARSLVGERKVISLTDTSSSERYETVTASLRNSAGEFVLPSTDNILAAAATMAPTTAQPQVRTFDPASDQAKAAPSAYPLTLPVYAATNVTLNSPEIRASYGRFVRYAATTGQTPGVAQGELPPGYAPLPQGWRDQALAAAAQIESGTRTTTASPAPASSSGAPAPGPASASTSVATSSSPVAEVPAAVDPTATGTTAAALSAGETPADPDNGALTTALPLSVLAGVLAAGAVPFVGRLRRRL